MVYDTDRFAANILPIIKAIRATGVPMFAGLRTLSLEAFDLPGVADGMCRA
jgi:hypothetical protein